MTCKNTEQERELFEAFASDNGKWLKAIERDARGNYRLLTTDVGWMWWQAAISTMRPAEEARIAELEAQTEDEGTLLDYAMAIAHERELNVLGHHHDSDGAVLRFRSAVRRALLQAQAMDIAELVTGMSVSVDVSTGDDDAGHRYFGTVTDVQEDLNDKHGLTLLVLDAEPNFTPQEPADAREVAPRERG